MLRIEWQFEYTAKNLATAAAAQRDFRISRIAAWEEKKTEVMKRIKESGITVHESVASGMGNNNINALKYNTTSDMGPQVLVDPTMQKDLNECSSKIRNHTDLRNQYDAWYQVLNANPESRVQLDHDDWMFFFGK